VLLRGDEELRASLTGATFNLVGDPTNLKQMEVFEMLRCSWVRRALSGLLLVAVLLVGFRTQGKSEVNNPLSLGIPEETRQAVGKQIYTLWVEGDRLLEAGDLAGAEGKYRAAYDLSIRMNDHFAIALSALSLGDCKAKGRQYNQAISWYQTSLKAFGKVTEPSSRMYAAVTWQNLGNAYRELGNDAKACETYRDGITAAKDTLPSLSGDAACYASDSIAYLYADLGDAYGGTGSRAAMEAYAKAIEFSGRAATCYRRRGQEQAAFLSETKQFFLLWQLADTCYSIEEYRSGLATYKKAIDLWNGFDISETCMDVELLFGLAYGHLKLGHADEAAEALEAASEINQRLSCELGEKLAYVCQGLAILFYDEESYAEAAHWAKEAAAKYLSLDNNSERALCKYVEGLSHGLLNQYREAITCLEEAVGTLDEKGMTEELQQVLEWLTYCRCQLTYELKETGSLRVATSCVTHDVDENNCPVDEARSFVSSDEKVVCWVALDGKPQGETLRFVFISPDGLVYYEGQTEVQWSLHWYWILINGYDAATKTGTWTVKVYLNNRLESTKHFELRLF
jgi:tetratricopeptide (TPR) repeat protein